MGARGEDGTAEKCIQPPAPGGEVRARGRRAVLGPQGGIPADPRALPTGLCPALCPCAPSPPHGPVPPVSRALPTGLRPALCPLCPEGGLAQGLVPGSARPAEPRAAPQGKLGTRRPLSGLLRQGRVCSPLPAQDRETGHSPTERNGAGGTGGEQGTRRQTAPGTRDVEAAGEMRATRSGRGGAVGIRPGPSPRAAPAAGQA